MLVVVYKILDGVNFNLDNLSKFEKLDGFFIIMYVFYYNIIDVNNEFIFIEVVIVVINFIF